MASRHRDWWTIPAAAILLLWPAIWNRYPIVFADTGTYLSQAIHRYAGWDRPVFYSLFIFPLHAKLSLWPIVAAQALLAAWVLRCVCRLAAPRLAPWAFMVLIVGLAIGTWLPWLVSEVMPDLFTPLLVLALWLLAWQAAQLTGREIVGLSGLATFAIAAQQSSLPLSMVLIGAAVAGARSVSRRPLALLLPLVVAIVALCGVNLAAHGRFSVSPFGNVFLLARSLYDGPGMEALRRDCPTSGWRLCAFVDRMPRSSDAFLWDSDSPLQLAGGPKQVSGEANAIIASGLRAEPAGSARAALRNSADQVTRFASGDGLEPWPRQVTPVITGDFPPAEATRYTGARQQGGKLSVPSLLAELHKAVAVACAAAGVLLLPGIWRRRRSIAGLLMLVLLALPVNAAITGVFSGPHDRYQARLMWLPVFVVPLVAAAFAPRPSVLRTSVPRMSRPFPSRPSPSRPSPSRPSPSRPSPSRPGPTGPSPVAPDGPVGPGHDGRTGVVLPDDPGGIGRTTRRPSLRRDAFWSALDAGVSGIFSLVTSFLVARLVGPQALGIGTAATALNVVLWVAVNALFADALVQQPELTEREASSAFWGSCLIGLGAAVLQAAVGWVLASMLDDQRLIGMALALALPLPLVGAAGVVQGLLTRERAYRRLALRTIFGQGLGSAVGIAGALAGLGPWAIVLQQALGATTGALALLLGRGWRPLAAFDRAALRRLLAIGLPLTGSTLVLIGRYRLFAVLIGASAGSTVLGEVHIAFRLVDTVRDLTSTALWRLLLPVLSPLQSDRKAMLAQVDRWMRLIGLAMLPVCAVLAFGLSHGVVRVMGPAWQSAGPAALPLVGLMAIGVLTFPASVALVAAGGVRIALYGHVASLLLTCAGVLLIPPSNAWQAVMVWCGSQILLLPYTLWTNARALGVGPLRPLFGLFMIVRPQIEALPAIRARAGS